MKILSLLILSLSFAQVARAECGNLIYIQEVNFEQTKDCELVKQYDALIDQVAKISGERQLPHVNLEIPDESSGASFSNSGKIRIGKKIFSLDEETNLKVFRSLEANHTTFVHEYGHAIFHALLLDNFAFYGEYNIEAISLEKLSDEFFVLVQEIKRLREISLENEYTQDEVDSAENQLRILVPQVFIKGNELDQVQSDFNKRPLHQKVNYLFNALHELFADIVTVTLKGDPLAMLNSILYEGIGEVKYHEYLNRSFNHQVDIESWSNEQAHYLFTPVRSFLGRRINFSELTMEEKITFIQGIQVVLVEFIQENWDELEKNPTILNKKLIEKIQITLSL